MTYQLFNNYLNRLDKSVRIIAHALGCGGPSQCCSDWMLVPSLVSRMVGVGVDSFPGFVK